MKKVDDEAGRGLGLSDIEQILSEQKNARDQGKAIESLLTIQAVHMAIDILGSTNVTLFPEIRERLVEQLDGITEDGLEDVPQSLQPLAGQTVAQVKSVLGRK